MFGLLTVWRESALNILTVAYGICGIAAVVSYAPQVWRIWCSANGARDLSLTTWSLWCVTSGITVLYAAFVAADWPFVAVSSGGLVGCLLVTGAALYRRRCGRGCFARDTRLPSSQSS